MDYYKITKSDSNNWSAVIEEGSIPVMQTSASRSAILSMHCAGVDDWVRWDLEMTLNGSLVIGAMVTINCPICPGGIT